MFSKFGCLQSLVVTSIFATKCYGALYESVSQLPGWIYDFIIVGGGTAGNVVANRLTENSAVSVLVLEAGVSDRGVQDIEIPLLASLATPNTAYDWNYTVAPQQGLYGRVFSYARGYVLGGCSSVNLMVYSRGSSDDYNRYASISGDPGWSWDNLQYYIKRNERFTPPADGHSPIGQYDPAVHGYSGINSVTVPGYPTVIDQRVLRTTQELSGDFPFNLDMNTGNTIGIGWTQETILDGARSSSATSYLEPQFINRPNLHILLHAQVTQLFASKINGSKVHSFHTVQFSENRQGLPITNYNVTAKKEVVLSAGSFNTPQLLMLSGIGNKTVLDGLGIKTLLDNPWVGQNMSDHPLITNPFYVSSNQTFDPIFHNTSLLASDIAQWNATYPHEGPLVDGRGTLLGWLRLPNNSSIFQKYPDPSAGPHSSHYEFIFANVFAGSSPPSLGNYLTIFSNVVSPVARGYVTINSTNPFVQPIINPNLLGTDFDVYVAVEAIKSARRFANASAWADYIVGPYETWANATTDAEIEAYARRTATSIWHAVGTSTMSPRGASWGVVDPDLRVKGVSGLRIVDASVIPIVPAAHTQAVVYIFAERGSDLIKGAWKI
ncbi:GMC oxidoreductase [Neolentinus lepideus HHB14362 ss-1]|uniref:GMC oxidoreductase n=1 Tax=Neolentinus lepideus HHB14362 ss-1 TaxID=1314782 RepID=A0A165QGD3_9AGAM|nr:GMC oxidoreductase [Neolentinus lepideus HHB14362 ss-1]